MIGDVELHIARVIAFGLQLIYCCLPTAFIPRAHQNLDLLCAETAGDFISNPFVRTADERDVTLKEFRISHIS